ncbi:MAG: hypothetical protein ORN53_01400 [Crocinitomicaceae bacterium]|nr:hypothetical protein [Crocinitomicaceae bacterium]
MNRCIEIIKYTWKAKGRHGIHSPFVYDLLDNCFKIPVSRDKIIGISTKIKVHGNTLRCLMQLSKHLKFNTLLTETRLQTAIGGLANELSIPSDIQNLSFFNQLEKEQHASIILVTTDNKNDGILTKVKELLPLLDENSLILIDGIRANDLAFSEWKRLKEKTEFHFSADVFHFGILAKRSFQEKEQFILRY